MARYHRLVLLLVPVLVLALTSYADARGCRRGRCGSCGPAGCGTTVCGPNGCTTAFAPNGTAVVQAPVTANKVAPATNAPPAPPKAAKAAPAPNSQTAAPVRRTSR